MRRQLRHTDTVRSSTFDASQGPQQTSSPQIKQEMRKADHRDPTRPPHLLCTTVKSEDQLYMFQKEWEKARTHGTNRSKFTDMKPAAAMPYNVAKNFQNHLDYMEKGVHIDELGSPMSLKELKQKRQIQLYEYYQTKLLEKESLRLPLRRQEILIKEPTSSSRDHENGRNHGISPFQVRQSRINETSDSYKDNHNGWFGPGYEEPTDESVGPSGIRSLAARENSQAETAKTQTRPMSSRHSLQQASHVADHIKIKALHNSVCVEGQKTVDPNLSQARDPRAPMQVEVVLSTPRTQGQDQNNHQFTILQDSLFPSRQQEMNFSIGSPGIEVGTDVPTPLSGVQMKEAF